MQEPRTKESFDDISETIRLRQNQSKWQLVKKAGIQVGQLAKSFKPPRGMTCIGASVAALVGRRREDEKPEYIDRVRCDCWEVVVPDWYLRPQIDALLNFSFMIRTGSLIAC
jgi:hypothetical protein